MTCDCSDQIGERRRCAADRKHLQSSPEGAALRKQGTARTDGEERHEGYPDSSLETNASSDRQEVGKERDETGRDETQERCNSVPSRMKQRRKRFGGRVGTPSKDIAGPHGETIGEQIGKPKHQDDGAGERGSDHAGSDGKRRHYAVIGAVDQVRKILAPDRADAGGLLWAQVRGV